MHNPDKDHGDWIEAQVLSGTGCNLKASNRQVTGFYLCTKKSPSGACVQTWPVYATIEGCRFKKGDYLIFTNQPDDFNATEGLTILKLASLFNLLSNEDAFIAYSADDKSTWQESIEYAIFFDEKQKEGYSLEKIDIEKDNTKSNWQESYAAGGTPGKENSKKPEEPIKEIKKYSDKIIINEIYPSPDTSTGEKEFIEIKNISKEKINLKSWSASDSIHAGKSNIEKDLFLEPGDLYAFSGTFYLNTPSDTAKIFDENKIEIASISYDKAKSGTSYAFDGSTWRWTKHITKGTANEFDELLQGKIKKDKEIYAGIYANFEAKADKKAKKFTWNFGDSHKSYLRKTRHKYENSGRFQASLKITGDGEDNLLNFEVDVEDYPAPKARITSLVPNPKGKDDAEYITIENKSKNKINLLDWSIATGWKNLVNHPIRKDFILKKGEARKLTKDLCAFTLNNEKTKIELRYPNGETAQKIKYNRKNDKIEDDEVFEINGKNETWIKPQESEEEQKDTEVNPPDEEDKDTEEAVPDDIQIDQAELEASLGKYSPDPDWRIKQENRAKLANFSTAIKPKIILAGTGGRVLGVEKIRSEKNYYAFTDSQEEKHWAVKLVDDLWAEINSDLNRILNKI